MVAPVESALALRAFRPRQFAAVRAEPARVRTLYSFPEYLALRLFSYCHGLIENSWREPPTAPRFCGSFWNGFDGFAVASTRGGRQTEEGGARDRSGGGRCEVADFSIGLLSVWPRRLRKSLALDTKQWIWPG